MVARGRAIDATLAVAGAAAVLDAVMALSRDAQGAWTVGLFTVLGASALAVTVVGVARVAASAIWRRIPASLRPAVATLAAAGFGAWAGLALFSGTGIHRLGLHRPLVALAVVASAIVGLLAARRERPLRASSWVIAMGATALYLIHATVLVRQYELLHALLAWIATTAWCGAASLNEPRASGRRVWLVRAPVVALMTWAVISLLSGHGARASVRRLSPLGQYTARLAGLLHPGDDATPVVRRARRTDGASLPLSEGDVVLVTVDALRADALRALGGRGRMPRLDALAARGLLFRRAYTATPHTSYSLASLMTGTHARAAMALGARFGRTMTLAGRLREAGYTTAGWYPPAVFFVDGDRFRTLASRHWDLQMADESWAPADTRVQDALRWSRTLRRDQHGFAWLHLFEPHEPYVVHPEHPYGSDARARYDAECSAVDDALGALIDGWARPVTWIITADHGEEFGEHGGSFHGTSLYDEQARVPLIIVAPGVTPRVVSAPVSLVDLLPTILRGVGSALPPGVEGSDLGALATTDRPPTLAFAETGSLRMVVDGDDKLIVDNADGTLERYDLTRDPGERRNRADEDPARTRALRSLVVGWEGAHGDAAAARSRRTEAVIPAALARALQGDRNAAREVAMLLLASDPELAARAARVLGDLDDRSAEVREALASLLPRPAPLSDEAAVSLVMLGDARGQEIATRVLTATSDEAQRRRAALGLAALRVPAAIPVLNAWAADEHASDAERDRAIALLLAARSPTSRATWQALLESPRLAPVGAEALGALGDASAIPPLVATLARTRYPLTRRAALDALISLGDPDVVPRLASGLGANDPLDRAGDLLARAQEPGNTILGSRSNAPRFQRRVRVALRARQPAPVQRIYLQINARDAGALTVEDAPPFALRRGTQQLVVTFDDPRRLRAVSLQSSVAFAVVMIAAVPLVAPP